MTILDPAEALAEALSEFRGLIVTLETASGFRYKLDSGQAPYVHKGVLVVPIVEDDDWS